MMQHSVEHPTPSKGGIQTPSVVKEITPKEAWQSLESQKTILVDVRTEQELPDAGKPDLTKTGGESVLISWRLAPDYEANPHFMDQLKQVVKPDNCLLFMCKVGGRSYEATQAAMEAGFTDCANILGGMDGEQGWKASDLPWGG